MVKSSASLGLRKKFIEQYGAAPQDYIQVWCDFVYGERNEMESPPSENKYLHWASYEGAVNTLLGFPVRVWHVERRRMTL